MLYNHELLRKLRIGAYILCLFLFGYATLTLLDSNLTLFKYFFVGVSLLLAAFATWLMKKPNMLNFSAFLVGLALAFILFVFRIRANAALDLTLLAVTLGLAAGFWSQAKKKSEFGNFE